MIKKKYSVLLLFLFGVVCILALIFSVYYFMQYKETKKQLEQTKVSQISLVEKVGKHILLPSGETPTIMTVTDKEKLSGQTFFANATDGDKVLIYEIAKKAFLYNTASDKIIEVGPVTFDADQSVASSSAISIITATPSATPVDVVE